MMLTEPNTDCYPNKEECIWHSSSCMMQFFSLKLAQIPINNNSVELYGYIATRDIRDSLLNYIVNRSRADPIIVQQVQLFLSFRNIGSHFIFYGPKYHINGV
jgi:hypothetical protein